MLVLVLVPRSLRVVTCIRSPCGLLVSTILSKCSRKIHGAKILSPVYVVPRPPRPAGWVGIVFLFPLLLASLSCLPRVSGLRGNVKTVASELENFLFVYSAANQEPRGKPRLSKCQFSVQPYRVSNHSDTAFLFNSPLQQPAFSPSQRPPLYNMGVTPDSYPSPLKRFRFFSAVRPCLFSVAYRRFDVSRFLLRPDYLVKYRPDRWEK